MSEQCKRTFHCLLEIETKPGRNGHNGKAFLLVWVGRFSVFFCSDGICSGSCSSASMFHLKNPHRPHEMSIHEYLSGPLLPWWDLSQQLFNSIFFLDRRTLRKAYLVKMAGGLFRQNVIKKCRKSTIKPSLVAGLSDLKVFSSLNASIILSCSFMLTSDGFLSQPIYYLQ